MQKKKKKKKGIEKDEENLSQTKLSRNRKSGRKKYSIEFFALSNAILLSEFNKNRSPFPPRCHFSKEPLFGARGFEEKGRPN